MSPYFRRRRSARLAAAPRDAFEHPTRRSAPHSDGLTHGESRRPVMGVSKALSPEEHGAVNALTFHAAQKACHIGFARWKAIREAEGFPRLKVRFPPPAPSRRLPSRPGGRAGWLAGRGKPGAVQAHGGRRPKLGTPAIQSLRRLVSELGDPRAALSSASGTRVQGEPGRQELGSPSHPSTPSPRPVLGCASERSGVPKRLARGPHL